MGSRTIGAEECWGMSTGQVTAVKKKPPALRGLVPHTLREPAAVEDTQSNRGRAVRPETDNFFLQPVYHTEVRGAPAPFAFSGKDNFGLLIDTYDIYLDPAVPVPAHADHSEIACLFLDVPPAKLLERPRHVPL